MTSQTTISFVSDSGARYQAQSEDSYYDWHSECGKHQFWSINTDPSLLKELADIAETKDQDFNIEPEIEKVCDFFKDFLIVSSRACSELFYSAHSNNFS